MVKRALCALLLLALLLGSAPAGAERDGFLSILLIGEDEAASTVIGQSGGANGRADAMILATLSLRNGAVRMLSIDRDYHIVIPGKGDNKLCIANFFGGPDLQLQMVNELLDLDVRLYAMVRREDMGKIIQKLGGVEIDIQEEDLKPTGLRKAGRQKLNGTQAIAYMAGRDMSENNSDIGRNDRQRVVLRAILEQTLAGGMNGMLAFADAVLPLMQTNVGLSDVFGAVMSLSGVGFGGHAEDRTPLRQERRVRFVRSHEVVYVQDMQAEIDRVHAFLYGQ